MAKKSRGGRMTAAKARAAESLGGQGPVKKRPAGRRIMKTWRAGDRLRHLKDGRNLVRNSNNNP